ncbi:hypothetical protein GCM10008905_04930 [Clostridium malenominatum]|uniref:DUF6873 domain-containing protein n=1 Tax=Clostridium malenominatum TaxID=1539 RepID=A0ABN1INV7_9CLOT
MKNYAIVDYRIDDEEEINLLNLGFQPIKCPPNPNIYKAICGHPDILMHIVDNENIILHKDIENSFFNFFTSLNFKVSLCKDSLGSKYPLNIKLNAVNLKSYFIHNIKYTDEVLLEMTKHKKLINVKQGYTKCSTAIVNDNAIITSDIAIARTLEVENFDVLLLPPGDISLPGLDYGFIGGCSGLLDENRLAFFGDLNYYSHGKDVITFLHKHGVEPIYLRKGKLIDRGSLFTVSLKDK